jgi:hypothetical protein
MKNQLLFFFLLTTLTAFGQTNFDQSTSVKAAIALQTAFHTKKYFGNR